MKIIINENSEATDIEIIINCRKTNEQILRICAGLQALDKRVSGLYEGQTFLLNATDILYIETVDRKTFLYTADRVYETPLRLYELEERLAGEDFIRAAKSCIINFGKVVSLRSDFGGKLLCTLENGEDISVSRQYAVLIKRKLEMEVSS